MGNKAPIDTNTKEFQYKFVDDLLAKRHWLKKWKIAESATCCYCKAYDENITHMFWTCSHTKQFWKDFTDFSSRNIRDTTSPLNDVLYGVEDGTICNLVFTAKTFAYNGRIHEDNMRFEGFKNHLYRLKDIEYQAAKDNTRTDQWAEKSCCL